MSFKVQQKRLKEKLYVCPKCNKRAVSYNFVTDRWECGKCGDIDLFSPSDRKKFGNY